MSRPLSPREVEDAADRALDRAIDEEFDRAGGDEDTACPPSGDGELPPSWRSLLLAALLGVAFPPAWCLVGAALQLAGV